MSSSNKSIDYIINNITKDITNHINSENFLKILKKDKEFLKYTNNIDSYNDIGSVEILSSDSDDNISTENDDSDSEDNISTENDDSDSDDNISTENDDSDSDDNISSDSDLENHFKTQKKIIKKLTPVFLFFILKIVKKKYPKPSHNVMKKYTYNGKQFISNKNIN